MVVVVGGCCGGCWKGDSGRPSWKSCEIEKELAAFGGDVIIVRSIATIMNLGHAACHISFVISKEASVWWAKQWHCDRILV
jgi:hypothetical protein